MRHLCWLSAAQGETLQLYRYGRLLQDALMRFCFNDQIFMLATLQMTPAGLSTTSRWTAHELEAWTCAFDSYQVIFRHQCFLVCRDICNFGPLYIDKVVCLEARMAFPLQADFLYSGGDDCYLQGWDLRQETKHPVFCNRCRILLSHAKGAPIQTCGLQC